MLTNQSITALHQLANAADAQRAAAAMIHLAVQEARAAGASWASIATMLGCSKQAAASRFTPKRESTGPRLF